MRRQFLDAAEGNPLKRANTTLLAISLFSLAAMIGLGFFMNTGDGGAGDGASPRTR
jgi:hypothetical protein